MFDTSLDDGDSMLVQPRKANWSCVMIGGVIEDGSTELRDVHRKESNFMMIENLARLPISVVLL